MLKLNPNNWPRPSLLWMSRNDIICVRNHILRLYLKLNEFIVVRAVKEKGDPSYVTKEVKLYSGITPVFEFSSNGINYRCWLKCPKGSNPFWDVRILYYDNQILETVDIFQDHHFNSPVCLPSARLIKAYSKHFPFVPSENFLISKGFVA